MKKFDTLVIGLMLFSMFFGAGNLIFPPLLGAQAGTSYWAAITGFVLTGVGLPFAVLLAVSLVKNGAEEIGNRVHPWFSTVFMVIVYLSIGPFLAIPRNATVAYEMGVKPFFEGSLHPTLTLLLFSVIFFALVYTVSLNPAKMEQYMGRWITPVLLVAMVSLCTVGLFQMDGALQTPSEQYHTGAFSTGFIEGYNTMDALAALAFGIVILSAIKQRGVTDKKQLTRYTLKAALVAGSLLSLVYVSLGLIGGKMAENGSYASGTELLTAASTLLFGSSGKVLLGVIFTLACFTTVVGLTVACGQYFSKLLPKISYRSVTLVVTLIGFTLSNMGLAQILQVSVPFLVMAYPLTIVLTILTFFSRYYKNVRKVYGSAILFTGVFAVNSGLSTAGIQVEFLQDFTSALPFASVGLEWILPALFGTALGLLLGTFEKKQTSFLEVEKKAS